MAYILLLIWMSSGSLKHLYVWLQKDNIISSSIYPSPIINKTIHWKWKRNRDTFVSFKSIVYAYLFLSPTNKTNSKTLMKSVCLSTPSISLLAVLHKPWGEICFKERSDLKLTCDKLGSFLEVGKYEVGHYVQACKQEYTDLQGRQKITLCHFCFAQFESMTKIADSVIYLFKQIMVSATL